MPGDPLAHYQVIEELGAGSFGAVYLARDLRLPADHPLVAIKQLHEDTGSKARKDLAREFALMARVRHRSLVKVFEFIPEADAVVMERVQGQTLEDISKVIVERGETVDRDVVLDIGMELLDCLYQAYSTPGEDGSPLQLVHRDLKPENVMLTPDGQVKVLDFGLARARRAGAKRDRGVKGTPLYMAPEQALDRHVDHRTDLFAVGLTLYELVFGESAYDVDETLDDPLADVYARIEAGELTEAKARFEQHDRSLAQVLVPCMAADPRDRPRDGHAVMMSLQALQQRPRGVALEAFCRYFYARDNASAGQNSGPPRPNAQTPRPTRRVSMSEKPPRPGGPPRPGASRGPTPRPAARRGAGPPRGGRRGPPGPRTSGPPAAPQRSGPIGPAREALQPAAEVKPEVPASRSIKDALSRSQARAADEDGMLEMVALNDDDEDDDSEINKSATAYFKVPKTGRGAPSASIGGPVAPVPGIAGPGAPPPMPGGPPPMPGGPPQAMGGFIQGPVAGGGSIGGPVATPFDTPPAADDDLDIAANRTRSFVTLAIIAGFVLVLFVSALICAGGGYYWYSQQQAEAAQGGLTALDIQGEVGHT